MSRLTSNISKIENLSLDKNNINQDLWTVIIPAAGIGSRLGFNRPKILYPILGRPILDWLIDSISPVASNFVFILSPNGSIEVEPLLKKRLQDRYKIVIQEEPTGMGDAILLSETYVKTPNALIIWGDQATIKTKTIQVCVDQHQKRKNATLTIPTILRSNPYIDIIRNKNGIITDVYQAREGEIENEIGENDCGIFFFKTSVLFEVLKNARQGMTGIGALTSEFNLLPILPKFELGEGSVFTVRISDISETYGINTKEDALLVEKLISSNLTNSIK